MACYELVLFVGGTVCEVLCLLCENETGLCAERMRERAARSVISVYAKLSPLDLAAEIYLLILYPHQPVFQTYL